MPDKGTQAGLMRELRSMNERMGAFESKLDRLGKMMQAIGKGCGEAFRQVKTVVEHLTEAVAETKQDLSMYGGYIARSTWDVDPLVEWG